MNDIQCICTLHAVYIYIYSEVQQKYINFLLADSDFMLMNKIPKTVRGTTVRSDFLITGISNSLDFYQKELFVDIVL